MSLYAFRLKGYNRRASIFQLKPSEKGVTFAIELSRVYVGVTYFIERCI